MTNELAVGFVSVVAETRGLGAQIDREMRGIQSKGGQYGRGLGAEVKKGFEDAKPIDTKQIEQNFVDAEKRRAALVRNTTEKVADLRRKEEIATAKLSETEKKYAADSSQVLAAKDRLETASRRVRLEEAKQSAAVEKATRDVDDAKRAVDDLARSKGDAASKSKGLGAKIGDSFRGIGRDAGAMGKEVGDSFAKIGRGDFRGAFSGLRSAFGVTKREGTEAGAETGQRFSRGVEREMSSGGSRAGSVFLGTLKGVLGAQVITSVLGGVMNGIKGAFRGGFDRIMSIQEAEIKLGTIFEGDAAKVKTAMQSVSDSVDGTKFAISDAADMASQLGAAGVEAGAPMEKWLSRTADAAQFSNKEFSEMQSIIGKVVANGKVTGETFDSLPLAAAALADNLGISQEEVRKLASQGKISAEQFGEAMDKKIGGAAKDAGGSFMSMLANIRSAMNATGAKLLKPVTDALMPIAGVGLTLLKGFRDNVAGPMGDTLSKFLQPKAEAFAESLEKLPGLFAGVRDSLSGIKSLVVDGDFKGGLFGLEEDSPIVGVVLGIRDAVVEAFSAAKDVVAGFVEGFGGVGDLGSSVGPLLTMLAGPLGVLKTVLFDLMDGLDFNEVGRSFGSAVRPIIDAVLEMYGVVGEAAIGIARELIPVVAEVAKIILPALGKALGDLTPLFSSLVTSIAPLVAQLISQLAPVLVSLISQVLPVVATLIAQLAPVIMSVVAAVIPLVAQLAGALIPIVAAVVGAVAPLITQLVGALAPIITNLVKTVLPPLMTALSAVADVITKIVVPVIVWLVGIIGSVLVAGVAQYARVLTTLWDFIANTVANALNFVSGIIKTVVAVISGDWSGAWEGIQQAVSAVWGQIKNIADLGINWVKDTILNIMGALTGDWDMTWEDVKSIGSRAWEWIKDSAVGTFESMVDAIGRAWDGIKRIVATPINAVIGFINKGIIGAYNWVADFLGIRKMGTISEVSVSSGGGSRRGVARPMAAFQAGGYVDLPWSATNRDPYVGVLPNGGALRFEGEEFIVNREQTKRNRGVLEAINAGQYDAAPRFAKGGRVHPISSGIGTSYAGHTGRDFGAPRGTPVRAAGDGIITAVRHMTTSYGKHIRQRLDEGFAAVYAHLSSIKVSAGQRVTAGQHIGGVGNTGRSFGDHLHFGINESDSATVAFLRGAKGSAVGKPQADTPIWATIGGKIAEGFKTVTDWISGALGKVTAPLQSLAGEIGNSPFGKLILGVGDKLKSDLTDWVTGKSKGADGTDDKPKRGYANGTRYAQPGLARVGEGGRSEIVDLAGGERIYSGGESERMAGRGGGDTYHVYANVRDWMDLAEFLDHLRNSEDTLVQLDPAYA